MAQISVVEVLDADFVDTITVLRQVQTVGNDGIAVFTPQSTTVLASVQSLSGDNLLMLEDTARTEGTYEIITTYPLATATDTTEADTVLWRGLTYQVISIGRFGNFANGQGHYEAIITLKNLTTGLGPP